MLSRNWWSNLLTSLDEEVPSALAAATPPPAVFAIEAQGIVDKIVENFSPGSVLLGLRENVSGSEQPQSSSQYHSGDRVRIKPNSAVKVVSV